MRTCTANGCFFSPSALRDRLKHPGPSITVRARVPRWGTSKGGRRSSERKAASRTRESLGQSHGSKEKLVVWFTKKLGQKKWVDKWYIFLVGAKNTGLWKMEFWCMCLGFTICGFDMDIESICAVSAEKWYKYLVASWRASSWAAASKTSNISKSYNFTLGFPIPERSQKTIFFASSKRRSNARGISSRYRNRSISCQKFYWWFQGRSKISGFLTKNSMKTWWNTAIFFNRREAKISSVDLEVFDRSTVTSNRWKNYQQKKQIWFRKHWKKTLEIVMFLSFLFVFHVFLHFFIENAWCLSKFLCRLDPSVAPEITKSMSPMELAVKRCTPQQQSSKNRDWRFISMFYRAIIYFIEQFLHDMHLHILKIRDLFYR